MDFQQILIEAMACVLATISFGLLIRQPKNTLLLSSLIALNGYICFTLLGKDFKAYFLSGLMIGLLSEGAARLLKMTTTIFLVSSIIPLVPGFGLYHSAMLIAERQYALAGASISDTFGGICAIALALTISAMLFGNIRPFRRKEHK